MNRLKLYLTLGMMVFSSPVFAHHYTFSIVPQQSASRLAKQWSPILEALSEKVGHTFIFTTATDIPTFESRLKAGKYDFAYMNPYHFVVYNQAPGYQALVHAKDKKIKGIIVVPKDSGITSVEQLNGKELAFPSPAAFAASILPRAYLKKRNISFNPNYVSSHDSVYLSISRGFFAAGGGIMRTFNAMNTDVTDTLNPLWTTEGYTPHAIAAHPSIPKNLRENIQEFFTELDSTPEGKALLQPLNLKGFIQAKNSDWDDVRALDINLLSTDLAK